MVIAKVFMMVMMIMMMAMIVIMLDGCGADDGFTMEVMTRHWKEGQIVADNMIATKSIQMRWCARRLGSMPEAPQNGVEINCVFVGGLIFLQTKEARLGERPTCNLKLASLIGWIACRRPFA